MTDRTAATPVAEGEYRELIANIERAAPFFGLEGEWTTDDCEMDSNEAANELLWLKNQGAVQVVRRMTKPQPEGCWHQNVYRWNVDVLYDLQKRYEKMDRLPCGHHAHIHNPPGRPGLGCRFCSKDVIYNRDTVERALK